MLELFRRLRARYQHRHFDRQLREELNAHRSLIEEDLVRRGATPEEVRRTASHVMGNVTLAREDARAVWIAPAMESVLQDLRYAVRTLRRSPIFSVTSILIMAIGVALGTALFTVFKAVGLEGWPAEHRDSLVVVQARGSSGREFSGLGLADVTHLQRSSQTLVAIAASRPGFTAATMKPGERGAGGFGRYVTPSYFDATGVSFAKGRNFRADEDTESAAPVAIISYRLWQTLFDGSNEVLERQLFVEGKSFSIIGVTREGWRGEQPYRDDLWLPMHILRDHRPDDSLFSDAASRCCVDVIGRLAPGADAQGASAELTVLLNQSQIRRPENRVQIELTDTSVLGRVPTSARWAAYGLLVAATIILVLLTGANLAHLHLARSLSRTREIRTRIALGASRGRVIRQLASETILIGAAAGACGLVAVFLLLGTLMAISEFDLPVVWRPDARVFGYAFGITLTMAITFSVLPALRARKASLLQSAGTGVTQAGRMRFNLVLLTAQIALSAVLLTTASLLGRAVAHATEGNAGWQVRGLTVATWRPEEGQARQDIRGLRQRLAENLDAAELPPWAFMDVLPFLSVSTAQVHVAGSTKGQARQLDLIPVSSSAFSVLGIRLREGRPFSDDRVDEAVLNAAAARLLWPDDSAVGKSLAFRDRTYLVTGVSDDVYLATRWTIKPSLHIPAGTMSSAPAIVVRGDGQGLSDRLKSIVRGVDPDATVSVSTLSDRIGGRLKDEKAGARAAWIGGLLALLLTTLGAFGIFSFLAQQRRREIGIRVALGASRTQILNALFRPVRIAILAGAGIGLVSSLSVAPALDRMLLGLSPFDPIAFAIVVGILTSAAMLATYLPARRALAVEPADVLRDEG